MRDCEHALDGGGDDLRYESWLLGGEDRVQGSGDGCEVGLDFRCIPTKLRVSGHPRVFLVREDFDRSAICSMELYD